MRTDKPKTGFTLVELLTVVSIILVLAVIGLPAAKQVLNSFESSGSIRYLISAALANARAIAARHQAYAGVRFQQDLEGNQYMTFIVHDSAANMGGLANGFRRVTGYNPMKLPENVGVMDLLVRTDHNDEKVVHDVPIIDADLDDSQSSNLDDDGRNKYLTDTTSFSIVFSPMGKLVIRDVRVRNKDGYVDTLLNTNTSSDQIFNKKDKVDAGEAMFYQDDYAERGLGQELSRNSFIIYDKRALDAVKADKRWTDYLQHLEIIYVSPYTGRIINR